MRGRLLLPALLLLAACGSSPPPADEPTLLDLTWMVGQWGDAEEGWFVRECWAAEGDALVGRSRAAAPEGLAWDLELRIEPGPGGLIMRTRAPGGGEPARPTDLVLRSATSREARFESPRATVVYRHDELRDGLLVQGPPGDYVVERIGSECNDRQREQPERAQP